MDVGAPSNYERMRAMYSVEDARRLIAGYWLDDAGTVDAMTDRNCHFEFFAVLENSVFSPN
jgi:threonine synthase